jgi:hypothetical protein
MHTFYFDINSQIRRSRISFLQSSAHRLLVQRYLIRSTTSCIQATMSLQHFLNGPFLENWHNRYAINSSSNNIHGPNATSAPHQSLASPALLHDENQRSQLDRSRSQHITLQPQAADSSRGQQNQLPSFTVPRWRRKNGPPLPTMIRKPMNL